MFMMRNDKRVNTNPTPGKKIGEAAGQVAVELGAKIAGDDLQLGKKGPSPDDVNAALDRVAAAEKQVLSKSMGTLGALPQYKKALQELEVAKAELGALREQAPKLVEQVEGQREKAAEKQSKSFWDSVKSAGLFVASPGLWVASKLFGFKF